MPNYTPANYNEPSLVHKIKTSARKAIGEGFVHDTPPIMGGEDFSEFGSTEEDVPTAIYWLGSVPDHRVESGDMPGLHSPYYYPDPEKTLRTGIKVNTQTIMDLFND